MRQLTDSEREALKQARTDLFDGVDFDEFDKDIIANATLLEGFTIGLDHADAQLAAVTAERDALQKAVAAWKKSAKLHQRNEIRKQKYLKEAVDSIDRLRAALDPFARVGASINPLQGITAEDTYLWKPTGLGNIAITLADCIAAARARGETGEPE